MNTAHETAVRSTFDVGALWWEREVASPGGRYTWQGVLSGLKRRRKGVELKRKEGLAYTRTKQKPHLAGIKRLARSDDEAKM